MAQCITSPPKPSFARSDWDEVRALLGDAAVDAPRRTALDRWACYKEDPHVHMLTRPIGDVAGCCLRYLAKGETNVCCRVLCKVVHVRGTHFMKAIDNGYKGRIRDLLGRVREGADGEPVLSADYLLEDHALAGVDAAVFLYNDVGRLMAVCTLAHDALSSEEGLRVYELEHALKDRTMKVKLVQEAFNLLYDAVVSHVAAAVLDGECNPGTCVEWRTLAIAQGLSKYYDDHGFKHGGVCYKYVHDERKRCPTGDPDACQWLGVRPMPPAVATASDPTAMDVDGLGATPPTDPDVEGVATTPPRPGEDDLGAAPPMERASTVAAAPDSTAMDVGDLGAAPLIDPGAESDTATPPRAGEGGLGAAPPMERVSTVAAAPDSTAMDVGDLGAAPLIDPGAESDTATPPRAGDEQIATAMRARHAAGGDRRQGAYAAVDQCAYVPFHYPPKQGEVGARPDVYPGRDGRPDEFGYVNPRSLQHNLMQFGTVAIQAR